MNDTHDALIQDQFTRQAAGFAAAPELHNEAVHALLRDAAAPRREDVLLDVACGPGSVVAAFAPHVAHATGVDATPAMLAQARALADSQRLGNVSWREASAYALPFAAGSFDIVCSRFAFHHLERIEDAFAEMLRVARRGARLLLCDGVADDDPARATAFNAMERFRDPSTVEFRRLDTLCALFEDAGLGTPRVTRFRVPYRAVDLVAGSFPRNDDRAGLLALLEDSVAGDKLAMQARRAGGEVWLSYAGVALVATCPG
ncbi:MAG: methyltransferase domain-containing protein [Gammaproteobacteria bacterium]|nr:methyltransferase domain-containing protein [Gammaproteobacteria bacterium]